MDYLIEQNNNLFYFYDEKNGEIIIKSPENNKENTEQE